jgi:hypothetical protein
LDKAGDLDRERSNVSSSTKKDGDKLAGLFDLGGE